MKRQKYGTTFEEAFAITYSGAKIKYYTAKERRRIFRRRPPEWIAKWKRVYLKYKAHQVKKSRKNLCLMMRHAHSELSKRSFLFGKVAKDKVWRGAVVEIPKRCK